MAQQPTYNSDGLTVYTLLSNVDPTTTPNLNYTVNSITVNNGGANYNYVPQIDITGGGGYGAKAVATIDGSGHVTNISVVEQGTGYSDPANVVVHIRGMGSVGTVIIANSGDGYSNTPTAIFSSPTYANGTPNPSGQTAIATIELAQNSVSQVLITDTGSGYGIAPSILVTAAQNNYPSYQANLVAILNTGVNATATANLLPTKTGEDVEAVGYYYRSITTQTVTWSNISANFSGNLFIQGALVNNPTPADWVDVTKINTSSGNGTIPVVGGFIKIRAVVRDFAQGRIEKVQVMY